MQTVLPHTPQPGTPESPDDATLHVTINGDARAVPASLDCAALLVHLALSGRRIAVERNGEIVPRSRLEHTPVAEGDIFEIVVAVGGG